MREASSKGGWGSVVERNGMYADKSETFAGAQCSYVVVDDGMGLEEVIGWHFNPNKYCRKVLRHER